MRRILVTALSALLIISMTACNQSTTQTNDNILSETITPEATNPETSIPSEPTTTLETTKPSETTTPEITKPSEPIKPSKPTTPETTKPSKPEATKPSEPITTPDNSESLTGSTDVDSLEDIMNNIIADVDMDIMTANTDITSDRFSWYFGIEAIEGAEGLASEAMIGSIAHSICILRLPEGVDANTVAANIEENANPRKWICVEAEKTIIKQKGNIVLLIMSFEDIADDVAANFDSI